MLQWFSTLGGIILVDLILSGDNALVIGAAAAQLPRKQRLWAIVCGGSGAILLRILFASLATFLFQIPLLGVIGAIIVLYIAVHLLVERSKELRKNDDERLHDQEEWSRKGTNGFFASLMTILVADVMMSLDNILAVGALAQGEVVFLIIGLTLSICLLLVGSALIAELINRLPLLLDIACLILAYTAARILLSDDSLDRFFVNFPWLQIIAPALALAVVLVADLYLRKRDRDFRRRQQLV